MEWHSVKLQLLVVVMFDATVYRAARPAVCSSDHIVSPSVSSPEVPHDRADTARHAAAAAFGLLAALTEGGTQVGRVGHGEAEPSRKKTRWPHHKARGSLSL